MDTWEPPYSLRRQENVRNLTPGALNIGSSCATIWKQIICTWVFHGHHMEFMGNQSYVWASLKAYDGCRYRTRHDYVKSLWWHLPTNFVWCYAQSLSHALNVWVAQVLLNSFHINLALSRVSLCVSLAPDPWMHPLYLSSMLLWQP